MSTTKVFRDFRQGSESGLTAVFQQYNRLLLFFAMEYVPQREVAEEIVSDSFIKAWQLRDQFDSLDKLRAFLYVSTRNACLNQTRSLKRLRPVPDAAETFDTLISEDMDTLQHIVRAELLASIQKQLEKLPKKQRDVFTMTYMEDLSVAEISDRLKISASAVYTNRSRAASALRDSLHITDALLLLVFLL